MPIVLNGTTGITTPNVSTDTSTLGPLTQALNLGSTGQIVFPATQNPSANANTLDDYEEGSWTPVSGANITVHVARYTRIGNVVTIAGSVSHTGDITAYNKISLPFAPSASGDARYTGGVQFFEGGSGTSVVNIRLLTQVNISPECFFWGNSGSEVWPFSMSYTSGNGVSGYTFTMTYMA